MIVNNNTQPIYRTRPLPVGHLEGEFVITESVITGTGTALTSFALAGLRDGGHEGLVYWLGREIGRLQVILSVLVPRCDHSARRVMVSRLEVGRAARCARSMNLGILAQVHSHPGKDARHSDGDDELILLPFEGMLSVVVPDFGTTVRSVSDLTVHQYQQEQWVWCTPESVIACTTIVPATSDLR